MKRVLALILALVMLCALTACGNSANAPASSSAETSAPAAEPASDGEASGAEEHKPVTLRVYVRYSDDDTILPYDYFAECLAKDMPWVTLELDPMPADDGVKLKSMAATGDLPDIFALTGTAMIDSMVEAGAVKDMTAAIKANGFFDKILPSCYANLYHTDGLAYTLPYKGGEVTLLYVNSSLFEKYNVEYPTTIDEWIKACEVFSANGITPLPIFGKEQWITNALYDALVSRYIPDGLCSLQEGTHNIREEAFLLAAKDLEKMQAAGAFPAGVTTLNYEQATELWYNDQAAMFLNGEWEVPTSTEKMGDKVTWIPFPGTSEESYEESQHWFVGGKGAASGWAVSAWSENYDVALEVACYMAEKYSEYNYAYRGSTSNAIKTDLEVQVELPPMILKLGEARQLSTSVTTMAGMGPNMELYTVLGEGTQSLLAGVMTAEEFIESVAAVTGD